MNTLLEIEDAYPGVGLSLRDLFFTGVLRGDEHKLWEDKEKTLGERKKRWKMAFYSQPQPGSRSEGKSSVVIDEDTNNQEQPQRQELEITPGARPGRRLTSKDRTDTL